MEKKREGEKNYIDKGAFAGLFLFIVIAKLIGVPVNIWLYALIGGIGAAFGGSIACLEKYIAEKRKTQKQRLNDAGR